jgi:hypothetical protein
MTEAELYPDPQPVPIDRAVLVGASGWLLCSGAQLDCPFTLARLKPDGDIPYVALDRAEA